MRKELICLVIGLSMVIGCGSREKVIRVAPPSVVNQLRDVLQQIADAGMIDSSIEYAKEQERRNASRAATPVAELDPQASVSTQSPSPHGAEMAADAPAGSQTSAAGPASSTAATD